MSESALVVEVEAAEPLIGHWRRRYDPSARLGMPAHVTALFPFRPAGSLGPSEMNILGQVAAQVERCRFQLTALEQFPGVLWLRPDPDDWCRQLTSTLISLFPDCPPYGGRFRDSIPHLTVGQFAADADVQRVLQGLQADIGGSLPLDCVATSLSLFVSDSGGSWAVAARFPFR